MYLILKCQKRLFLALFILDGKCANYYQNNGAENVSKSVYILIRL